MLETVAVLAIVFPTPLLASLPLVQACDECNFILSWGGRLGAGQGQFRFAWGVAVDSSGNVYVTDRNNNRVQKFAGDGTYILQWASRGLDESQLTKPARVAVDSSGSVYVTANGGSNSVVGKFGDQSAISRTATHTSLGTGTTSTQSVTEREDTSVLQATDFGQFVVEQDFWLLGLGAGIVVPVILVAALSHRKRLARKAIQLTQKSAENKLCVNCGLLLPS